MNLNSGIISENSAKNGGGVGVLNANVNFGTIEILNNTATGNGGGLHVMQAQAEIIRKDTNGNNENIIVNTKNGRNITHKNLFDSKKLNVINLKIFNYLFNIKERK